MDTHTYRVPPQTQIPLLSFMLNALENARCQIIHRPSPGTAPFRITYEAPSGERAGIVAYAFPASAKTTRNQPGAKHRFQATYGTRDRRLHELWQDPYGIFTTLLVGINPDLGFFVGADPVLHSPTRFPISIEFSDAAVKEIVARGWHVWERDGGVDKDRPVEILVGGTADSLLHYLAFERAALGEDQGHRHLLADKFAPSPRSRVPDPERQPSAGLPRVRALGT
jgi:hypothetical protein